MKRIFALEQYVLIGGIAALLLAIFYPFLQAILLGLFFSLLLYPLYARFQKISGLNKSLSALFFTLIFSILVVLPLFLLTLSLVSDATDLFLHLRTQAPTMLEDFLQRSWVIQLRDLAQSFIGRGDSINLNEKAIGAVTLVGAGALDFVTNLASRLPGFLLDVGIFLMTLFFGLMDGTRLVRLMREVLPFDEITTEQLFSTADNITRGVMLGTLVVCMAQAFLVGLGYWITGLPNPLFFSGVTAILSLLPLVGSAPIGFGGVIYLLVQGNFGLAIVMLCFALASTLSDNILKPIVLKNYSSIHPLLGILSVLGGLALFGFLGIFLGPLIAALGLVVIKVMSNASRLESNPAKSH